MSESDGTSDLYLRLAQLARQRYESLRNVEWKVDLGLWGFLIGASAVLINAGSFPVSAAVFYAGVVLALFLVCLHAIWLQFIYEVHQRDNRTAYWWECRARIAAGAKQDELPKQCRPPDDWRRPPPFFSEGEAEPVKGDQWRWAQKPRLWVKQAARKVGLHEAHVMRLAVTLALALLLCAVLWNRTGVAPSPVTEKLVPRETDSVKQSGNSNLIVSFLSLAISFLSLVISASVLGFAIYRFGLKRERFGFVRIAIEPRPIHEGDNLILVAVTVHLENKGDTKISARRTRTPEGYLYDRDLDKCMHAGTIKIRAIPPDANEPLCFDWYSLPPLRVATRLVPGEHIVETQDDLEQVNYLGEYQDVYTDYKEVNFWLEPREVYDLVVPVWLRPGIYAAKAFFLGDRTDYREDEFWSCQTVFAVAQEAVPRSGGTP